MPQDDATLSAASAGSVRPFAWAVCNPVGTYYRSFGYHREALECCLQKTRETGDCFYVRALYAAPPQPTLTDAEREAVGLAIDSMNGVEDISASWSQRETKAIATLQGLLERTK